MEPVIKCLLHKSDTPKMQNTDRVGVQVTNVSNVSPLTKTSSPSSLKLSFFDTYWIFVPPVQRLFFYSTNTPYKSLIQNLKHSLSLSLQKFYPLTGKLFYSPESGELEIDCSDGEGIVFVEAESDNDFGRLAGDDVHDVAAFRSLVPELDISELPAPLLSVQVTRFAGGGIAVGISIHHVAIDGRAVWNFVKSWAYTCRTGVVGLVGPTVSHDRTAIGGPLGIGISKLYLQTFAPWLPKLTETGILEPDPSKLMRRTFVVNSKNIRSLKERSMAHNNQNSRISTFVVVGAHIWICNMRAKGLKDNETTCFFFLMDCRSYLDPPVDEGYFGNCVRPCIVMSNGRDLLEQNGIMHATTEIRKVIHEASEEPLKNCKDWAKHLYEIPLSRMVNVVSSPRFPVYDVTDFGWGRPSRVELASSNQDGMMVLTGAKDEGGVQVSVTLSPTHMDKFATLFLADLDG
eukprot:TRINITY_DN1059_c0_g3_i1.p1 TRINITY_DN1059_c0_g3~~TRINITY_DN1059_c0_g3_i1.p1  ORF type:complete len:459 (-),score=20.88 TRINITY_DN1059_c0_g3_i1:250-1626(-)